MILFASRKLKTHTVELLKGFKHRTVLLIEQSHGYVNSMVGVDPYEVRIEGRMMGFGEW